MRNKKGGKLINNNECLAMISYKAHFLYFYKNNWCLSVNAEVTGSIQVKGLSKVGL